MTQLAKKEKKKELKSQAKAAAATAAGDAELVAAAKPKKAKRRSDDAVDAPKDVAGASGSAAGDNASGVKSTKVKKGKKRRLEDAGPAEQHAATVAPAEGKISDIPTEAPAKKRKKAKKAQAAPAATGAADVPPTLPLGTPEQPEQRVAKKKKSKKQRSGDAQHQDDALAGGSKMPADSHAAGQPAGGEDAPPGSQDDTGHARSSSAKEEDSTKEGTGARAFQRVKTDEWLGQKGSWSNHYEDTFGAGGWGYKAQQVLGQVRGKDFRHEKTKKKRGSYKGGAIDPQATFSYKFESDDE